MYLKCGSRYNAEREEYDFVRINLGQFDIKIHDKFSISSFAQLKVRA